MKKYAIVVAAGAGKRMKSEIEKQFLLLNGKPVYFYSVSTFLDTYPDMEVVLVMPASYERRSAELLSCFERKSQIKIVKGGSTRYESVRNGLLEIEDGALVFIHDAVRPFVNKVLLDDLLESAMTNGNAVPYSDVTDSLRIVIENDNHSINREQLKAIQTPQVFHSTIIKKAYQQPYNELFTDDASVLESEGHKIHLVKGLTENIKITTPLDLRYAELILNDQTGGQE